MEELKKEPVTVFLILVNVLVFLVVEFTGGTENTGHMLQCGAAYTPAVINGEFYRLFTSMFLHFGSRDIWGIICWYYLYWVGVWSVRPVGLNIC